MNGLSERPGRARRALSPAVVVVWGSLSAWCATGPGSVNAAPIRSHALSPARTRPSAATPPGAAWPRFLNGGPAVWAFRSAPRFPSGLRLPTRDGRLVETRFVDYLLWRRALNPLRFDFHHPNLGPALALLKPPAPPVVPQASATNLVPPINPQGQGVQVPEPGMLAVSLLMLASGLGWNARHRRRDPG